MFSLSILFIFCLTNVSNKLYHLTGEDQLYAQQKISTGECCLGEHCVISWRKYGPKWGILWNIYIYIFIILISGLPNVSNKTYNETGDIQLYAELIYGLVIKILCQLIEKLWFK